MKTSEKKQKRYYFITNGKTKSVVGVASLKNFCDGNISRFRNLINETFGPSNNKSMCIKITMYNNFEHKLLLTTCKPSAFIKQSIMDNHRVIMD